MFFICCRGGGGGGEGEGVELGSVLVLFDGLGCIFLVRCNDDQEGLISEVPIETVTCFLG